MEITTVTHNQQVAKISIIAQDHDSPWEAPEGSPRVQCKE